MSGNKEILFSIDESVKFEVRMGINNKVLVMVKDASPFAPNKVSLNKSKMYTMSLV
jgi:hypothetical protein